ncbi:MAG: universal stress protein [Armatimonadetes bacterium]|nr:universal stress protein [Armatimonadota bacterium]
MQDIENLIVGVDFSARSRTAAEMAVCLAKRWHAKVELVHVVEVLPGKTEAKVMGLDEQEMRTTIIEEARRELSEFARQLKYRDVHVEIAIGRASEQLTHRAKEINAGLVIIGDSGARSTERRNGLGATAHWLVEKGPNRVLVVKPRYHGRLDKIAAAVDFSPVSTAVLESAAAVAAASNSELSVIHICSTMYIQRLRHVYHHELIARAVEELTKNSHEQLEEFLRSVPELPVKPKPVALCGSPGATLAAYLREEQIDLVAVGTGTSPRIAGFPIGSTTNWVANDSPASVLVVHSGK